jgi:hypothetical protein
VEAGPERIRHHLRRPVPGRPDLLTMTAGNTVSEIDPLTVLAEDDDSWGGIVEAAHANG